MINLTPFQNSDMRMHARFYLAILPLAILFNLLSLFAKGQDVKSWFKKQKEKIIDQVDNAASNLINSKTKNILPGSKSRPLNSEIKDADFIQNSVLPLESSRSRIRIAKNLLVELKGKYPEGYQPSWRFINYRSQLSFEKEDWYYKNAGVRQHNFDLSIGEYDNKAVIRIDAHTLCECYADIVVKNGTAVITKEPQVFQITNFRKILNERSTGEACQGGFNRLDNNGGWEGKITLSANDNGDILMTIMLENYSVEHKSRDNVIPSQVSYRYIAKNISVENELTSAKANRFASQEQEKNYDEGIRNYSNTIGTDPRNKFAYVNRGNIYNNKGDYGLAIADFTKAINIDENYYFAYNARGVAQKNKGEYESALQDFNICISLDPEEGYAYINAIISLAHLNRFADAASLYETYTTKQLKSYIEDPNWSFVKKYIETISLDVAAGDFSSALLNLNEAEKLYGIQQKINNAQRNTYSSILALKGYILEKLNRFSEAKDIYKQALTVNPNLTDVTNALEEIDANKKLIAVKDKTPPVIELINPAPSKDVDVNTSNPEIQIIGRITDESGAASVKINDKAVTRIEDDGVFISTMRLVTGQNKINISATDKQGNVAEKTFTINGAHFTAEQKKKELEITQSKQPRYYAILIAEQSYTGDLAPLQNPIKDAKELKAILETKYSFSPSNIDTLFDRSRENIMQAIVQKCNTLTENDNLLIFYAGHGTAERDKYGDVEGYWIPVSARQGEQHTYITAEDIKAAIKRSKARHILVVADACFGGALTRGVTINSSKKLANASIGVQKQYAVNSRKVMASGNLEPVPDNSRFIYYLKKTLKENQEKYLSAKKAFDSFYDAILNNSDNLPQYAAIKNVGDEGGEFIFIRK